MVYSTLLNFIIYHGYIENISIIYFILIYTRQIYIYILKLPLIYYPFKILKYLFQSVSLIFQHYNNITTFFYQ